MLQLKDITLTFKNIFFPKGQSTLQELEVIENFLVDIRLLEFCLRPWRFTDDVARNYRHFSTLK